MCHVKSKKHQNPLRLLKFHAAIIVFMLFTAPNAWADSTFIVDDELKPIVSKVPELWAFFSNSLELQDSAMGIRISNEFNPRLGGKRIGPYCLLGKPKGAKGAYSIELCINTEKKMA